MNYPKVNENYTETELKALPRIAKMLRNFGLEGVDNAWNYLLNEGVAMRDMGYTYKSIEKALEEKLDNLGSKAY